MGHPTESCGRTLACGSSEYERLWEITNEESMYPGPEPKPHSPVRSLSLVEQTSVCVPLLHGMK